MTYGMFGLPKRPIGTGGVFGGQFEDEPFAQQPAPQKRGGFLGEGGAGRGIAGTIGDYLLQMSGARPIYAPAMQQKQAMAFAEQQRKQAMQDQKELLNYKAGLPQQAKPDAFERALAGAGIDPQSPQGQKLYADRAAALASNPNDEFVVVPLPGGRTYAGPKSGLATAMGSYGQQQDIGISAIDAELKRRGVSF